MRSRCRLAQTKKEIVTAQVMAEMAKPRDTFILARGDYRNQTEKVTPGVPAMLPPMPKDAPANRLGLAEWLFSPQHPLTARVAVNRYWQLYFGTGLVKTTEDFGSQGDAPVQRDVLDWLATEFQTNWDVKAMQRLIVTSATYRQVVASQRRTSREGPGESPAGARSALPPARRDGSRQCAGRQPPAQQDHRRPERLPLPAARTLGGTLPRRDLHRAGVSREHGRRSLPPQHVHLLEAHRAARRAQHFRRARPREMHLAPPDHQHAAYRPWCCSTTRPMWKRRARWRSAPCWKRPAMPHRALRFLFREATARRATPAELRVLVDLAQRETRRTTRKTRQHAAKLIAIGASKAGNVEAVELAAWTTVASTILNLDETITKE